MINIIFNELTSIESKYSVFDYIAFSSVAHNDTVSWSMI